MLNITEKENESDKIEKILDSPRNKSRVTMEYEFNPTTDLLGKGGFGEVFKVKLLKEFSNQKNYAIKIFDKNNLIKETEKGIRILNEIKIHRVLNHQYICKYEHSFEDKKNVYILMEYCENGNLASFLKTRGRLEEIEIRFYMFQVLLVLKYLRKQKIIHRDLTLGNIFLKNYKTIKIGDFGLAFRENEYDEKSGIICGTPGYYTPESNNFKYSYKTDIFDFGVCIYYLFGGKLPLGSSLESFEFFLDNYFKFEKNVKLSKDALDLIQNTITIESKRIDLDKIFEHPFFKKGKGLSKDSFPDYNEKDYMDKIKKLTEEFDIKPIFKQSKKEIKNKKNKGEYSSSSSSHFQGSNEESSSSEKSSSSSVKKKNTNKNVTFNFDNLDGKSVKKVDTFKEHVRNSLKNIEEINFKFFEEEENEIEDTININEKNPNFNNTSEMDDFIKKVYQNNYKYYYYFYKNQKKLDSQDIIYVFRIYDNLKDYCGIGYELNNKNIGFIFNDDSQMTKLNNNLKYIFYHERDKNENITNHNVINLPPKNISLGVENKIKFLWQIIEEFNKNKKNKEKYLLNKKKINNIKEDIYVIKYKKRHKAYFFILSNSNIQVRFFDGINIIFHFFPKCLIYISNDKKSAVDIFPLNYKESFGEVECIDPVINSRIKYALREIKK